MILKTENSYFVMNNVGMVLVFDRDLKNVLRSSTKSEFFYLRNQIGEYNGEIPVVENDSLFREFVLVGHYGDYEIGVAAATLESIKDYRNYGDFETLLDPEYKEEGSAVFQSYDSNFGKTFRIFISWGTVNNPDFNPESEDENLHQLDWPTKVVQIFWE